MKSEVVRLDRVTYMQDETTLLKSVNLHIFKGEIMGLTNLNSLGQNALVELLHKNIPLHYGQVYFNDKLVNSYRRGFTGPNRVSVIEQRSHLIEDLSVADNIFVLHPEYNRHIINTKGMRGRLISYADMLGMRIDAKMLVGRLSHFQRTVVELLKAVVTGSELIIMRDISNFLGQADLKRMQEYMRIFSAEGIAFLYICNHHEEVFGICDRMALMEDGRIVKVIDKKHFSDEMIWKYALDFSRMHSQSSPVSEENYAIRFDNIHTENINGMSFSVGKGECVTLLDIDNNALDDFAGMLSGHSGLESGSIMLAGHTVDAKRLRQNPKVRLIRENPIKTMLYPEMSYIDNLCFPLSERQPALWLDRRIKKGITYEYRPLVGEDIYAPGLDGLSRQSLYNLVYFQLHLQNPGVVFLEQPFAGADMYLRHQLLYLINQLLEKGIAIIILAVSISDCLIVSDRLFTIEDGRINKEYGVEEFYQLYKIR